MEPSKHFLTKAVLLSVAFLFSLSASETRAAYSDAGNAVYMMPMNCSELLPDSTNFLSFFDAVAKGTASEDKVLSKRLLRMLSLREKVNNIADLSRTPNPVDTLIQKTLCFYRVQKEPLKPIPFDDADFLHFLKTSLKDLETKIEDAVFQVQFEKFQREEYARRVQMNRNVIQALEKEADKDADRAFDRLSESAKRKARTE
jgi:hypothetical protein